MKKLVAPLVLALALTLTACSGTQTPPPAADSAPAEKAPVVEAPKPADLVGSWKQNNAASEDSFQQATITADTITIEWVADGGATTAIYWVGTFQAPTDANEPYVWTSQRDAAATDSALMASTDDTKEFTFEGEEISYPVSALGMTTTVSLART
ncbi:activator of HSP90 ATPase [Okibacterium sp. HSC-33S16]|uniref:hypothetical protein n=1 Tax=Okibacterium sp. HSC-33S16 TaxID=2910965 RepID=UPI0020A173C8|nr:hypothetical protein [Okibacterium sp. HSC-33S16]MCP2031214.1 activator of HSP90 ATPase [Okibacterium sp. HSC-33S16]